jgi:DNA-binding transcriptional LysR family regulator
MRPGVLDTLPNLAVFVAVANALSFSVAARRLGMPVSTVSRRIAQLEASVGLQLLRRTSRTVELTEAGAAYLVRCRAIVEAAEAAHEDLDGRRVAPSGELRLSATPDFSSTYLTPFLIGFAARHPEVRFLLDLTPRTVDLVGEGFDVAIRIGPLADSQLTVRTLATVRPALYASPAYLAAAGTPTHPRDLAGHATLRLLLAGGPQARWRLERHGERVDVEVSGRFVANNVRCLRELAVGGLGITPIDPTVAAPLVAEGALVPVLPGWAPPPAAVQALLPSRLVPARTRVFLDEFHEHLRGGAPA